jgi:tripartite-type tricarboxylate transporter receptor subunit TctC
MRSAAEAQNHTLERKGNASTIHVVIGDFSLEPLAPGRAGRRFAYLPLQPASAEQFPDRPIRIIVPVGAGGGTDVFARALADTASSALGQPVVVENRPGASGTIGVQQVINASPDGYTIGFVWNSPLTAAPHSTNARYTPDDYVAMFDIGYSAYTLCAQPSFPANSLKEMIEEVRARPNTYTWGNEGAGGTLHLGVERVLQTLGLKMTVVPFQGGSQSLNALLGGHISFYGGSVVVGMGAIRAKTMKCLLLTTAEDNPEVPGASGLASIGLADHAVTIWWGMIAPKGIPAERMERLQTAFQDALQSERIHGILVAQGATPRMRTGDTLRTAIHNEYTALGEVAKRLGLQKP